MKLKSEIFSKELRKILDAESWSPEALANRIGAHVSTIYRILKMESPTAQRDTARKIAEHTDWYFKIDGESIKFFKRPKQEDTKSKLDREDEEILEIFRRQSRKRKREIITMVGTLCKMMDQEDRSND